MEVIAAVRFINCSILHLGDGERGEGKWRAAEFSEHLVSGIFVFFHALHSFNILSSVLIIRGAGCRGFRVRTETFATSPSVI